MALKCLKAALQWTCLQAYKAILTHGVIFIAAACLQQEQIVWFSVYNPLTSTINIPTEHEGRGDIIKTVLEGFDPKLAGVLVVAGALQRKEGISYMWGKWCEKKSHCIAVKLVRLGLSTCQGPLVLEAKGKSCIIYFILTYKGSDARLSSFSSCDGDIDF